MSDTRQPRKVVRLVMLLLVAALFAAVVLHRQRAFAKNAADFDERYH